MTMDASFSSDPMCEDACIDSRFVERVLNAMPVIRLMGVGIQIPKPGSATVSLNRIESIHLGGVQTGAINGMTLMGMADASMCAALLSIERTTRCATLAFQARFVRASFRAPLTAHGIALKAFGNDWHCTCWIFDGRGRLSLEARATIRSLKKGESRDVDPVFSLQSVPGNF